jgi:GntR family transcriptional regulator, transcriptional repressor for pyruvate dehydrogenase complex
MKHPTKPLERRGGFRRLKRPQLVGEIINHLRSRLASGELKVGDKLPPESILVSELGVGRTTLREAVRVLEHAGLLSVRHGSGTYIRSTSDEGILATRLRQARVLEVFEVRRALDIEMMRMAVAYRTSPTLAAMRDALDLMKTSLDRADDRGFLNADMEMYRILAAATRNSIFMEIYASFAEALRVALTQVVAIHGVMQSCWQSHEQLYEAIVARDADRAEAIAKGHLDRVTRLIESVLGDALVGDTVKGRDVTHEGAARN